MATPTDSLPHEVVDDEIGQTVERLRLVTLRIARRIRSQSSASLTPSQITVLLTIATAGPLTITQISELEHVKPPAVSKIVATLVESGLVARAGDDSDRRRSIVSATAEGQAFLQAYRAAGRTWLLRQIDQLDQTDRDALTAVVPALERLLAASSVGS